MKVPYKPKILLVKQRQYGNIYKYSLTYSATKHKVIDDGTE